MMNVNSQIWLKIIFYQHMDDILTLDFNKIHFIVSDNEKSEGVLL